MKFQQLILAVVALVVSAQEEPAAQRRRVFDVETTSGSHVRRVSETAPLDTTSSLFLAAENDEELIRALGSYGSMVGCSIPFRTLLVFLCGYIRLRFDNVHGFDNVL